MFFTSDEVMVMKAAFAWGLIAWILILALPEDGFAFRCGSKLLSVGNTKDQVLNNCGPPTSENSWEEERLERVYGSPYSPGGPFSGTRVPLLTIVYVRIDEWTYNFGPSYFMRTLRFENNRLVDIQTGSYGY